MIEISLSNYLSAQADVSALIGTSIHPVVVPTGATYPVLTYRADENKIEYVSDGYPSIEDRKMILDCYSNDYPEAKNLAELIKDKLKNFRNQNLDSDFVNTIQINSISDFYDKDLAKFKTTLTLTITYRN